jgi:chromatin structure-remodeling complex protein RSC7
VVELQSLRAGAAHVSLSKPRPSITTANSHQGASIPAPPSPDIDEEMQDAPEDEDEKEDSPAAEEEEEEEEEIVATPPAEEEEEDEEPEFEVQKSPVEKTYSPPVEVPRKRRIGRPPKFPRPERDLARDDGSEGGTPQKRKRGRPPGPGSRGGRGGRGSYVPQSTKVRIDKEGTLADVENDEVVMPDDEEGEAKVDKDGNLQGGREYRVRTFKILNRGSRLDMLSTEPARCCGFRDSYLFFTKHLQLYKVVIEEDEKRDLIDRDVIPHSYKGRSIGVVTARSVFREFGARIIVGGKKVIDDYKVTAARGRGDIEGELADPNDKLPAEGQPYNRNQYVAWHGASAVYHSNLPNIPIMNGKPPPGKRKVQITGANWQFEHARAARYVVLFLISFQVLTAVYSRFNSSLVDARKQTWNGVYDPHTNVTHYPKITQPSHVKWDFIPNSPDANLTNGHSSHTIFSPVSNLVARNFLVVDTTFVAPTISGVGLPGPETYISDLNPNGLPNLDQEMMDELPEECRTALLQAKEKENKWKQQWGTETENGMRAKLKIGFLGFPV